MRVPHGFKKYFTLSAYRPDSSTELDDELEFHFQRTREELRAEGYSPGEAEEEAGRRFGDLSRHRARIARLDRQREADSRHRARWEGVMQDLGYTLRGLRRSPGFSITVILTLALGIGANATMFGVVDRLLLSPPAQVGNPDEVVRLFVTRTSPLTGEPKTFTDLAYPDYLDFLAAGSLESVAAFGNQTVVLGRGEDAERLNATLASASYFPLLQVRPFLGRFFDESEDAPGQSRVVVLGHSIWKRRFGEDRSVIGREVDIGNNSYTIIGVAPEGFNGVDLARVDLFLPLHSFSTLSGTDMWTGVRWWYWLNGLGRISPTSSMAVATEEATTLHRNGRQEAMDQGRYPEDARIVLGSVIAGRGPDAPGEVQISRWLVGVTLIVLLIACANVANLLLARGYRRRRELGIRVALGIPRRRLVGQLLLETFLLATLGGLMGLAVSHWGGHLMRAVFLPEVAWATSPVNQRVFLLTLCLVGVTGVLAGLAPAWREGRAGTVDSLRNGGRGGTDRRFRSQNVLLMVQAALSVVLLVGAGLFVRSLDRVHDLDLGLEPDGLLVATLELNGDWDRAAQRDLATRALERMEALPGVERASFATAIPFQGTATFNVFVPHLDSIPVPRGMGPYITASNETHLATLGIGLRAGRFYSDQEAAAGSRVAVVSENMARGLWGADQALGQCFMITDREGPCWEVVGVMENSKMADATGEAPWQYYLPMGPVTEEMGMGLGAIFIRGPRDDMGLVSTALRELRRLDPGIRFAYIRPQQDLISVQFQSWILGSTMFTIFGFLALVVAMVGLYSALAFDVARRTRELGIRSALGAARRQMVGMVLRAAVRVTSAGVAIGLLVAFLAADRVGPLLFDTSPRDPLVFAGAAFTLLAVAVLAGLIPGWAACRVDPMRALREE